MTVVSQFWLIKPSHKTYPYVINRNKDCSLFANESHSGSPTSRCSIATCPYMQVLLEQLDCLAVADWETWYWCALAVLVQHCSSWLWSLLGVPGVGSHLVCKHLISGMLWGSKQHLQMKSRRQARGSLPQPAREQVLLAPGRINGFCKDKALTPGLGVRRSACPEELRALGRGLIAPCRTGRGHHGSSSSWDSSPCLPPNSSTLLICYKHHFKDVPALLSCHFPRALLG